MGDTDRRPAEDRGVPQEAVSARNARYGLRLFVVYLAFYAGFVLLNAFAPEVMDLVPAAGVNLAIWYGFALIFAALALALVYVWLCRDGKPQQQKTDPAPGDAEGRP